MRKVKILLAMCLFIGTTLSVKSQDEDVFYNDTLTKRFFNLKKAFSKRSYESTYYTIQIFYGSLYQANSIYRDFRNKYSGTKAELIFETPNYKVRVGRYKSINVASQSLEKIRKKYPGSFIIKLSNL